MVLNNKFTVLMPVYNEQDTIETILKHLMSFDYIERIIVINDGSTDETENIVYRLQSKFHKLYLFTYYPNKGKGAALAMAQRLLKSYYNFMADYIIIHDADLEYNPDDLKRFTSSAPVIMGNRLHPYNDFNLVPMLANKFLTWLTNLFFNTSYKDVETCYKAIRKDVFLRLPNLKQSGFGIEIELAYLLREHEVDHVDISYYPRTKQEGKKINWKDGVKAILLIIKYGLSFR